MWCPWPLPQPPAALCPHPCRAACVCFSVTPVQLRGPAQPSRVCGRASSFISQNSTPILPSQLSPRSLLPVSGRAPPPLPRSPQQRLATVSPQVWTDLPTSAIDARLSAHAGNQGHAPVSIGGLSWTPLPSPLLLPGCSQTPTRLCGLGACLGCRTSEAFFGLSAHTLHGRPSPWNLVGRAPPFPGPGRFSLGPPGSSS